MKIHKFYKNDGSILIYVIAKTLEDAIKIVEENNINLNDAYIDLPKKK